MYEKFGKSIISLLEEFGKMTTLAVQSLGVIFRLKFKFNLVLDQMVKIGFDSIPVAVTTSFFVGMVFSVQIAYEFTKFGAGRMVGGVMVIAIARELAPALTGVVIAARIGAAIAAELGTMNVTLQIDAIRAMGSSPVKYLVVPRVIACTLMLPILTIIADIVGFVGGYIVSVYIANINPIAYMDSAQQFLKVADFQGGLLKAFIFGFLIAIISCSRGLSAKGGAKGVGQATTSAVVISLITIFISNYFLSMLLFK